MYNTISIYGKKDHANGGLLKTKSYAESTFLPFNLLRARTFLPLAVLILALKP